MNDHKNAKRSTKKVLLFYGQFACDAKAAKVHPYYSVEGGSMPSSGI